MTWTLTRPNELTTNGWDQRGGRMGSGLRRLQDGPNRQDKRDWCCSNYQRGGELARGTRSRNRSRRRSMVLPPAKGCGRAGAFQLGSGRTMAMGPRCKLQPELRCEATKALKHDQSRGVLGPERGITGGRRTRATSQVGQLESLSLQTPDVELG